MAALTTIQQAKIMDGNNVLLVPSAYSATSSDPTVATVGLFAGALAVQAPTNR